MHEETLEKVKKDLAEWKKSTSAFDFPKEIHDFFYHYIGKATDDIYDIFCYNNPKIHKSITAYYHEETHEYKLRIKIGLIEFCNIEFIFPDIFDFYLYLKKHLSDFLEQISTFRKESLGTIMEQKGIIAWGNLNEFPEELNGFHLYIHPKEPVKITNGSFIILDYIDFDIESNLSIYFNIYRDEFFGEARIKNIPDVFYDFDSTELKELEIKLGKYLEPRLNYVRESALNQIKKKEYDLYIK